tara:strand:+ start:154 stop:384 length:231 start_codon:yes stop_codon:yes gene_type:complete
MYAVIVAMILANGEGPSVPLIVSVHSTLKDCRTELIVASKLPEFEFVTTSLLGYGIARDDDTAYTMAFCVKNGVSI